MKLDRSKGALPLYKQLEKILSRKIENEEFKKGEMFLSEKQIQEKYDVSRITVRQAMNHLVNAGYIKAERGIGTVVIFEKIDETLGNVISFSEEMRQHGLKMYTHQCSIEKVRIPEDIAAKMDGSKEDSCYKLIRTRCVNKEPIVYSITYLRGSLSLSLDKRVYEESLYQYLKKECRIQIVKGRETFEAITADGEVSKNLKIKENAPVIKRIRKTYDAAGDILEYTICYYAGDKYKYSVELG